MTQALPQRLNARLFGATPVILQSEAAECGLACLAMVAGHHGHRMDLPAIRRRFSASMKGTTLKDLAGIGEALHLATRALRLDLEDLSRLRLPCVLHWDHNHFVVLTRVGARAITIHDPAIGRRKVPMAEVSRKFTGIALETWPTDGFARRDETVRISILDMIRRTRGIGAAVAQVLAVSLLLEITVIAMPIGFQLILDEVVVAADRDLLTILVIALAFLLILQVAASFARSWITLLTGSGLALQWKVGLFDHLMRLPLAYYEKRHVGDIVSRFGSLDSIQRTVTASAVTALLDGVMSLALIAMMWLYGGWLLWLALLGVGLYAVLRLSTWGIYRRMSEEAIVHAAQENTHFMESVRGIGSVKVLNLESRRQGTWINHLVERLNAELRVQKFDVYFRSGAASIFGIDRLLIIYFGVMAIIDSAMTVGMFVAFLAYKDQFADRINSFIDTVLQFRMLALHGERIADIAMAEPEEEARRPLAAPPPSAKPARLEMREVRFRYADNDPEVLKGIGLRIEAGECVGVAGPSGAGKTTLLKVLAGLARPGSGQVLIDGVPLDAIGLAAYRSRVGCVLQEDRLFAGSIIDNITGFASQVSAEDLERAARMAAIHDEIRAMPMGYETLVGDMGSTLSGGQKQRIVLARALYRRPSVLLMDEATSHLDSTNEEIINLAIRRLGMTRIVIAHRETTLAMTDRIIRIDGGIAADDPERPLAAE
ncbi:peptidase domain-containing ABC transporter (plasmid) [Paracoccus versutus]|uniref:ATP-binding cassette subfamily B protein RaxB n=1 Tax=Paracoccus versutus TaxID=34007 RepID=A0AAQ0HI41_PARVE|nr:peptidase domain-containing ABC transporter [Paracoccus versutus]REG44561.1 ATP-binding cassette subfamily B protein RaxB [Paracoccus versutus]WEJ80519.1 peptidase domain-containing ABC transporter [Paracoccus versutus]